jgi:hypothetical protein
MAVLQNFFQDKSYGVSVSEIAGRLVCVDDFQLQFIGLGTAFNSRKMTISSLVKVDYEWVKVSDEVLIRTECKRLLLETFVGFSQLDIKDFDVAAFVADFKEFLRIIEETKPEKLIDVLPPLNAETLAVYDKKWKRFLKS